MRELTLNDVLPLVLRMFESKADWDVLIDHPDSLRERAALDRVAVAEACRVFTASGDEKMSWELFFALGRALGFDPEEIAIPGVADDLPLEDVPWTAGLYRELLRTLTPHGIDRPLLLVRFRSGWSAAFLEAGAALRTYSPDGPLLPLPPGFDPPAESSPEGALSVEAASRLLRFHPKTTLRYLKSGDLRGEHVGRRWAIRREDVSAFERHLEAKGLR